MAKGEYIQKPWYLINCLQPSERKRMLQQTRAQTSLPEFLISVGQLRLKTEDVKSWFSWQFPLNTLREGRLDHDLCFSLNVYNFTQTSRNSLRKSTRRPESCGLFFVPSYHSGENQVDDSDRDDMDEEVDNWVPHLESSMCFKLWCCRRMMIILKIHLL